MTQNDSQPEPAEPDMAEWLDDMADRFESIWLRGERPVLADFLTDVSSDRRSMLARELIPIDVHHCLVNGRSVAITDYEFTGFTPEQVWFSGVVEQAERDIAGVSSGQPGDTPIPAPRSLAIKVRCPHCHNPINLIEDRLDDVVCPGCGSSFSVRHSQLTTTLQRSRQVGKYQMLELVGRGAFGEVWRARDEQLQRIVALKIPHGGQLTADTDQERFYREARIAAQLRHPGVVAIYEIADLEGLPAIASEFVQGVPLQDLLDVRQLTFAEAAELTAQIADALDYAHSMGAIHRDIKPSNVMIERREQRQPTDDSSAGTSPVPTIGRPKIMDFGLAMREDMGITLTVEGQILGTPAYMSPEQAAGKGHTVDGRADVYSLGAMMYQMLCGQLPFRGSKLMLMEQVLHEEPRPPRKINDKIPRDLETICLKAMSKTPAKRYDTARAMADDLRRWARDEPIIARPVGRIERMTRWCRRNPRVAILTGIVMLLLASVAAVATGAAIRISREKAAVEKQRQFAVEALVHALLIAQPSAVSDIIGRLQPLQDLAVPILRHEFNQAAAQDIEKIRAACGLASFGHFKTAFMVNSVPTVTATECGNMTVALYPVRDQAIPRLKVMIDGTTDTNAKIRIQAALAGLGDASPLRDILALGAPRATRTRFIHTLGAWWQNWRVLIDTLRTTRDSGVRAALCNATGLLDPATIPEETRKELVTTLTDLYRDAPDGGTHSTAGWALRQWHQTLPDTPPNMRPPEENWFVDKVGLTMIRVPDGEYAPGVTAVRGFYLADREVTIGLFQRFIEDPVTATADKPEGWQEWRRQVSRSQRAAQENVWGPTECAEFKSDLPLDRVSAVDAIKFCNWLSRKNGRTPCYTPRARPWLVRDAGDRLIEVPGWNCDFDKDGYRLPTLWEWRYAAGAGAFPHHFGSGISGLSLLRLYVDFTGGIPQAFESNALLLSRYAWFDQNSGRHPHPTALLMPSPWGFFDTFGNVNELCWSRAIPGGDIAIGGGDWTGSDSYCSLATSYSTGPYGRGRGNGIRVAFSDLSGNGTFQELLATRQQRFDKEPENLAYANGLALTYMELGDHARDNDDREGAMRRYDQAADVYHRLLRDEPSYSVGGQRVQELFTKRAVLNERWGNLEQALDDWLLTYECETNRPDRIRLRVLGSAMNVARGRDPDHAFDALEKLCESQPEIKDPEQLFLAARVAAQCAQSVMAQSDSANRQQRRDRYREFASRLLDQARAAGLQKQERIEQDPLFGQKKAGAERD